MKKIVIFLNNKLISVDTILPVLYDVHLDFPGASIVFYCNRKRTYDAIKRNIFVWNTINKIGKIIRFSGMSNNFLIRRLVAINRLFYLASLGLMGNTTFIHFKGLNTWPLKVLYYTCPRKIFLFQNSSGGNTDVENKVDGLMWDRRLSGMGSSSRKNYKRYLNIVPVGRTFVGYYDNWTPFFSKHTEKVDKLLIQLPITRKTWRKYIDSQFESYFSLLDLKSNNGIAVYILSSMDQSSFLDTTTTQRDIFSETLDVIINENPGVPIVLKPHPATTPHYFKIINNIVESKGVNNILISEIHPMILAKKALYFIANSYSTTFTNAYIYNVPTIEYTNYPIEYLNVTNGKSMRDDLVTFFINYDKKNLASVLTEIVENKLKTVEKMLSENKNNWQNKSKIDNYDRLISRLVK